jgi:hypothetical protein
MRFGVWGNSLATEVVLLRKLGGNEVKNNAENGVGKLVSWRVCIVAGFGVQKPHFHLIFSNKTVPQ